MTLRCSHRGCRGHAAENTLTSIKEAIRLNSEMIEVDAQKCLSGEIVLMHDNTIDRTTNGKGMVRNMRFQQLRDVKTHNNENIPALKEALELIKKRCILNIEVKDITSISNIIKIVRAGEYEKYVLITSTFVAPLLEAKRYGLKTGLITWSYDSNKRNIMMFIISKIFRQLMESYIIKKIKKLNIDCLNMNERLCNKEFIHKLRSNNIESCVWTVNNIVSIKKFKKMNVDIIISDYPERI